MKTHKGEEGFTMILVAAILVIAAMTAATLLQKNERDEYWNPRVDMRKRLQEIGDILTAYQRTDTNLRLPCPAGMDDLPGTADFGREVVGCNDTCGNIAGTKKAGAAGTCIRIGMLPVRTLGLLDDYAIDSYGNRLLYAVRERLTNSVTYTAAGAPYPDGNITIEDESGTPITTIAAYVIISPGKNRYGAVSYKNPNINPSCTLSTNDDENCFEDNAVFVKMPFDASDTASASYFDDQVFWSLVDRAAQIP